MFDGGAVKCSKKTGSNPPIGSNPTIRHCVFANNTARGRAGAIYIDQSSPVISNCRFINNTATSGYGGAIACFFFSSPIISNCVITGNTAAGADHHGGGICCWEGSNALVLNCLVTANSADHRGGGLYAYWSDPTFINCTVVGNWALEGGGICSFRESDPFVINCIVRDNRSPDGEQLALINTSRVWPASLPTSMHVLFSNIQGGMDEATIDASCTLDWGEGNIDSPAGFLNPGLWFDPNTPEQPEDDSFIAGDYHITPSSPCYQAGDSNSLPAESIMDLDGQPRILDNRVEMGSDEVFTHPMDFNVSGRVDLWDLSLFLEQWLTGDDGMDFNNDESVNLVDYASFAAAWLWKAQWDTD
jgi:predicted outer membrane repeat protein